MCIMCKKITWLQNNLLYIQGAKYDLHDVMFYQRVKFELEIPYIGVYTKINTI
jgi:hypothetical protein